jgi:MFS family permease
MTEKDETPPGVLDQERNDFQSREPSLYDQKELDRLGRERPACFSSLWSELGFIFAVVGSMMVSEYFVSGFNIILPSLANTLDIPDSARTWPAAVINLTTAALLLPFARLAEIHGGRFIFLGGHVWLIVWSVIGGFSQNPTMLIAVRAMQGLGPSAFLPSGVAIMSRIYRPGPRKNFVFSMFGAFSCIGFYSRIFFGALSAQVLGWKWYFFIGAIVCASIFITSVLTIPKNHGDPTPDLKMD